jgi:protein-S-isoprenylcysteine O-methyltransferase Ste14
MGMNGSLLLIPLLLIRYGVLSLLNKEALKRAAFFPPMLGRERTAYWIYQISTLLILACLCFLRVIMDSFWFYVALTVYGIGVSLLLVSTVHFARPAKNGINLTGLYRICRNPMYVAYFVYFLGCVLLTRSLILLALLLVFQISAHWIILAEERWCLETFGEAYAEYRSRVRRYL